MVSFDVLLPFLRGSSPAFGGAFGSVAFSMPLGLIFGRPGPPLSPSNLVALGINRSPKLGHFPKQLQHQIFEFGVRKAVEVKVGRRHSQNESDSRPLVNRKIIPPRLLPLLRISSCQSSQKTQSGTLWEDHSRPRKSWGSQKRGTSPSERLRDRHGN